MTIKWLNWDLVDGWGRSFPENFEFGNSRIGLLGFGKFYCNSVIWGQFHQHFAHSFYTRRYQKGKKTVNSSSFLRFWDLWVQKQKLHVNTLMKLTPEGFEGSTTSVIWGSTFSSLSWRHSGFIPDLSVAMSTSRAVNRFSNHVRPCSSFQICQRSGEIEKDRPRFVKSV